MSIEQKQFKERRIWYFACAKCGKAHRQSHKKRNATNQICMKCRRMEVPENQARLFGDETEFLSDCCHADFDPWGREKEEGIWQEKCLKCGKECEPILINKNQ